MIDRDKLTSSQTVYIVKRCIFRALRSGFVGRATVVLLLAHCVGVRVHPFGPASPQLARGAFPFGA